MTTLNRLLIRDRLNLLVLVPLSVVLLMTVPFVADRVQDARQASTTASQVSTAGELGSLVQELERERLLSVSYLASPDSRPNPLVTQAQTVSDEAVQVRRSLGAGEAPRLEAALAGLSSLTAVRDRVLRRVVSAQSVNATYGTAVATLIDALGLAQGVAAGSAGARQQTALDALLRADEENSSAGAGLLAAVAQPGSGAAASSSVGASIRLEQLETRRFQQLATPAQVSLFQTAATGRAGQRVQQLRGRLLGGTGLANLTSAQRTTLTNEIFGAVETEAGLRRLVQDKIARDISGQAQAAATKARLAGLSFATLAIVLLVVVILLSVAIGRSIARPLRRLTIAASQVADLAQSELIRVTDEDGDEGAPVQLAAIDVAADDEIGDLAAALNRVQATAALLLERQVAGRRNIAAMFGSVGRRTQNLVGRQLSMIDALERNEQNLELLQRLYRLDHLSARLRRHADSLVVLSGSAEPSLISTPLSVGDVIRSALGEIEDFQRVRLIDVGDIRIVPDITRDLKLLLAELMENATSFSPPFTEVEVSARMVGENCQLDVVDHGVGMGEERMAEENARLVRRERLDVTPTDVLGLFVVGRLCRRHGLEVILSATPGGGVTAQLTVPGQFLAHAFVPGPVERGQVRPSPIFPTDGGLTGGPVDGGPDAGGPAAVAGLGPQTTGLPAAREPAERPLTLADSRAGNGGGAGGGESRADGRASGPRSDAPPNTRGLVQRVRGAQLPDTGDLRGRARDAAHETPEAARDLVEQFEAGALRALRDSPSRDRRAEEPPAGDLSPDGFAGRDLRISQPAPRLEPEAPPVVGRRQPATPAAWEPPAAVPPPEPPSAAEPAAAEPATEEPQSAEPQANTRAEMSPEAQHASTVRSFALEIDRELRRTLESLTHGGKESPNSSDSDFHWLDAPSERTAPQIRIAEVPDMAGEPENIPPGFTRRVRGAQMPKTGPVKDEPDRRPAVVMDAAAARAAIEEFESGVARAMEETREERPARGGGAEDGRTQRGDGA